MSDTAHYSTVMRQAFPKARHGSVYSAQYAAFDFMRRHLGKAKTMTFRRVRSIWEGAARRIDACEARILKRAKYEEAKRERTDLYARLSELDADLAALAQELDGGAG